MNFEPGKFYIGVIDFFSVLLPGALLVYLTKDWAYSSFIGGSLGNLHQTEQWLLVAFASYLLGHFIFLIGAAFLDDHVYDRLRAGTYHRQVNRLARGKKLSPRWIRFLAAQNFDYRMDKSLGKILELKALTLNPLQAGNTINAFKWCKIRLSMTALPALAEVERYEANSKFFRSLFVVLAVLLPFSLIGKPWYASPMVLVLMLLSLWRYIGQRKKAIQHAYWSVITQEADKPDTLQRYSDTRNGKFTHAGGVVYIGHGENRQYLLVRSRSGKEEWVLPKGHIEPGETPAETAVREIREETGVWAKIDAPLGKVKFKFEGEKIKARFFSLQFLKQDKALENRSIQWARLEDCIDLVSFEESRELLGQLADQ
jgi:8-oxo-dGTP pyrophosphatase MutT (NUDIX family)